MEKTVLAKNKYLRMSPRKVRLVVDLIRGTYAAESSLRLGFMDKDAATHVKKTLDSAISNAVNNFGMKKDLLKVVEARVDEAPMFKRGRAVSKGRYHQILKRNSHIIIRVAEEKLNQKEEKISNKESVKKEEKVVKSVSTKNSKSSKITKKNNKNGSES